ncbi:tRNA (guanine-N(1)-)-methyltransferase [Mycobacterium xenopi 3993]|nr:tRNA (guanine-N(1)-)-methyltransferase [Mycobacterium xenopi 3993]
MVPTPAGVLFDQATARRWSTEMHLVFACGRYEGIDQRVMDDAARRMRVEEVSIGDYVLPGGESAALVMIEAVLRLLPNVLGNPQSLDDDSHSPGRVGLLEGRATPGRRAGVVLMCPRCCCPATTPESPPGVSRRRGSAPGTPPGFARVAEGALRRLCSLLARNRRIHVHNLHSRRDQMRPVGNIVLTALVMVARAVVSSEGCSDSTTMM